MTDFGFWNEDHWLEEYWRLAKEEIEEFEKWGLDDDKED